MLLPSTEPTACSCTEPFPGPPVNSRYHGARRVPLNNLCRCQLWFSWAQLLNRERQSKDTNIIMIFGSTASW